MLFENKRKEVDVLHYEDRETVQRKINFKTALAEEINVVLAVFNKESLFRMNNSNLTNIAMNHFFQQLKDLPEEKIVEFLEEKFIAEAKT